MMLFASLTCSWQKAIWKSKMNTESKKTVKLQKLLLRLYDCVEHFGTLKGGRASKTI